jgi:hypothetical protein
MHQGKLVFAQVMAHLPLSTFRRCVARYDGEHKVKSFSCLDQFYAMAFAQLTFRESLRDIEACLATQGQWLYHLGFRSPVARNTLANANAVRPWQIYADLAQHLIGIARPLYANEPIGLDLKETVYAFDATTIDLCLSVYPWAPFRSTKAAIKLHTLLDVRGSIPSFIHLAANARRHAARAAAGTPAHPNFPSERARQDGSAAPDHTSGGIEFTDLPDFQMPPARLRTGPRTGSRRPEVSLDLAPQWSFVPPTCVYPLLRGLLRGPRYGSDRPLRGDEFEAADAADGSVTADQSGEQAAVDRPLFAGSMPPGLGCSQFEANSSLKIAAMS